MRKVDGLDCLRPSLTAFSVNPGQQGRSSPAGVRSLRRLRKQLKEVLTLSIPTRNVVVSSTTWDILFGCCADGITEVLVCPSTSDVSGGNKLLASWLVRALQWLHSALRKFHRLTGILGTDRVSLGGIERRSML